MTRLVQIRGTKAAPVPPASAPELPDVAGPRVYVETLGCQMN
jgi:hypothetical protein